MKPRRREALERLAHEHVRRELGESVRHREKPGQAQSREQRDAGERCQAPAGRAGGERIDGHRDEGERERHRPLGERSHAHGCPRERGPLLEHADHRGGGAECEGAVEDGGMRVGEGERHGRVGQAGDPSGVGSPAPAGEPREQRDRGQGGNVGRESRRRLGWAERLHQRGGGGEVHDRLVEVGQPVEMGDQVVVGARHLARHLGVPTLVGIEEAVP